MSQAILAVEGFAKNYGAIAAVRNVGFDVGQGEIFGVIGPNGSGKTTLFNSILGQIRPDAGRAQLEGLDITGRSPLQLAQSGLGRTFQSLQVFGQISVRDNMIAAAQEFAGTMFSRLFAAPDAGLTARADELLRMVKLDHLAHRKAGELSYGQQKLIDIAMAFMARPKLVFLDEPLAGVNPTLINTLSEFLIHMNRDHGVSFVLIEHNMEFVMKMCHRVMCMVEGQRFALDVPDAIRNDPRVLDAYLGN
jgi:branched-chain amino acid transport system ATP-binding protein